MKSLRVNYTDLSDGASITEYRELPSFLVGNEHIHITIIPSLHLTPDLEIRQALVLKGELLISAAEMRSAHKNLLQLAKELD